MHVVQLLLPLYDNEGRELAREPFAHVRGELAGRFGGVTAYSRAPAEGVWVDAGERVVRDDVVVFEVMVERLDRDCWGAYRAQLERRFRQDEVVIRATEAIRL